MGFGWDEQSEQREMDTCGIKDGGLSHSLAVWVDTSSASWRRRSGAREGTTEGPWRLDGAISGVCLGIAILPCSSFPLLGEVKLVELEG